MYYAVMKNNKVLIITDSGVPKKHIRKIKDIITCKKVNVLTLNQGEKSKSFASFQKIMNMLFNMNFDRSDSLIALGGGVVGVLGDMYGRKKSLRSGLILNGSANTN